MIRPLLRYGVDILHQPAASVEAWRTAGFEATAWWAVFAPPGLPAEVTARLHREIARIVGGPVLDRQLRTLGVRTLDVPLGPFQKAEIDKWGAAVRASGVALD